MRKLKERIRAFLEVRAGSDQLSVLYMVLTVISLLSGCLFRSGGLFLLGAGLLVYSYMRIFSKNKEKRRAENMKFLGILEHHRFRRQVRKLEKSLKKTDCYVICPGCGKKYRIQAKEKEHQKRCPFCGKDHQERG